MPQAFGFYSFLIETMNVLSCNIKKHAYAGSIAV